MEDNPQLLEVYRGNLVDVDFVKSVLEGEGIRTFLDNERTGSVYATAGEMSDVRIFVSEEDWERADGVIAVMEDRLYGDEEDSKDKTP